MKLKNFIALAFFLTASKLNDNERQGQTLRTVRQECEHNENYKESITSRLMNVEGFLTASFFFSL